MADSRVTLLHLEPLLFFDNLLSRGWVRRLNYPFLTLKERDVETGLDYFEARYYSAVQGRFVGADDPFADWSTADPQRWNLYSYTSNNPTNFVDPNGEHWAQLQVSPGVTIYQWFDHEKKDEDGKTAYDRALESGWSQLLDPFVTELGTGRRLYLSEKVEVDGVKPEITEVSSWLEEVYLRYVGPDASRARAARVNAWWAINGPRIERDLDALPLTGGIMAARRGAMKAGMKFTDAVSKLRLQNLSLTSGTKKLRALGLGERVTKTGRREFFDTTTGAVRAAWDSKNKGGNHWHKFALDGKTPLNDGGRVVGKTTGAAHIPSK